MIAIRVQIVFFTLALLTPTDWSMARADAYRMNIKTNVEKGQMDGKMTLQYVNLGKRPLKELRLRLDLNLSRTDSMRISHVRDNAGEDLSWRYVPFEFGNAKSEKAQINIDLPAPLNPNSEAKLQITFLLNHVGSDTDRRKPTSFRSFGVCQLAGVK